MKKIFLFFVSVSMLSAQAQNVGIGTANPTRAKLEVHGAVDVTSAIFGGESSGISLQRNWPAIGFNSYFNGGLHRIMSNGFGAVQLLDPNSGYMAFDMMKQGQTGAFAPMTRAMVIANNGGVNIGSADLPLASLSVGRNAGYNTTALFKGTTYHSSFNSGNEENTYIRAGVAGGKVFINDVPNAVTVLSNRVGINTTSPAYPLEIRQPGADKGFCLVNANSFHNWEFRVTGADGALVLYYDGVQRGQFFSDGDYHKTSDQRLKTNITGIATLLPKLMQLNPVTFEMAHRNASHQKSYGFVAQEVERVFPELVTIMPDTSSGYQGIKDVYTLNYSAFGVMAIKAIQEQQALLEKQERRIAALEEKLAALDKKMAAFQANR